MMPRLLVVVALLLALSLGAAAQSTVGNFTRLLLGGVAGAGTVDVTTGTGSPESSVTGSIGDIFIRTNGGYASSVYVKENGSGTTGWSALGTLEKVWLQAASCQNATALSLWSTPTSDPAIAACVTGTNTQRGVLDFADSSDLSAQTDLMLPADFASTVDARIYWHTSATSGNVVWQLATVCVADAETGDPAFNAASTVTDAAKGTTLQFNTAAITSVTITGCAAGEMLFLKIQRNAAHASDSLAATARLVGIELTIRRAQL